MVITLINFNIILKFNEKKKKKFCYMLERIYIYFWSTQIKNLFGKIQKRNITSRKYLNNFKQKRKYSTFINKNLNRSSETNTQNTFSFKKFLKVKSLQSFNKNEFIWLIGFIEGLGFDNLVFNSDLNILYFYYNNYKVLYRIKRILNFGQIKKNKTNNLITYKYLVIGLENIYAFFLLFNGNLVLFSSLNKYKDLINSHFNFIILNTIQEISLNDSWFSGYCQINLQFKIDLKLMDKTDIDLKIKEYNINLSNLVLKRYNLIKFFSIIFNVNSLNIYINFLQIDKLIFSKLSINLKCQVNNNFLKINKLNLDLLINYFNKFFLLEEKHIEFVRFKKIYIRLIDSNLNEHLKRRSLQRLELLLTYFLK